MNRRSNAGIPEPVPAELHYAIDFFGEPDRIRTCDPLIKSQLLYQLSYGPNAGVC